MLEQHGGNDPEYRAGADAYLQHVKNNGREPDLGKQTDNFQRGWIAMHDMRQHMFETGEYRTTDDLARSSPQAARENTDTLKESLSRLAALRIEYADNPDKHVLAEARGIAEALGGPDVTRIPLASAASEYVKGNVSRADLEILAGKNERAASHSHDNPEDRSQGNDLGR